MLKHQIYLVSQILMGALLLESAYIAIPTDSENPFKTFFEAHAQEEQRYEDRYYGDDYVDGRRLRRPRRVRRRLRSEPVRRRRRYRGRKRYYEYRYGNWKAQPGPSRDGLHEKQEGEFDKPYKWELDFDVELTRVTEAEDGVAGDGFGRFSFSADALYIFSGKIGIGPLFDFTQKSTSADDSEQSIVFGAKAKYNFGLVDEDIWLFFVEARFALGSTKETIGGVAGDANPTTLFGGGIGVHYFVDSNVALTALIDFRRSQTKNTATEVVTIRNTLGLLRAGLTIFI